MIHPVSKFSRTATARRTLHRFPAGELNFSGWTPSHRRKFSLSLISTGECLNLKRLPFKSTESNWFDGLPAWFMAGLERVVFVCVWDAAWDTVCAVCCVRISAFRWNSVQCNSFDKPRAYRVSCEVNSKTRHSPSSSRPNWFISCHQKFLKLKNCQKKTER